MKSGDAAIEITMKAHEGYAGRTNDKEVLLMVHQLRKTYPKEDPFLDAHRMLRIYEDEAQRRGLKVPGGAYRASNPKQNARKTKIVQKPTSGRKLAATLEKRRKALAAIEERAFAKLRANPHPKHLPGIEVSSADELKRRGVVGFVNVWKDPDTGMWQHRLIGDLPWVDPGEPLEEESGGEIVRAVGEGKAEDIRPEEGRGYEVEFDPETGKASVKNPRGLSARGQVGLTRSGRTRSGAMASGRRSKVTKELKKKRTRRALAAIGNPSKEKHHELGDEQWNKFMESYDLWDVGGKPKDLLNAYEAAVRAERHYNYAGIEHDRDGRGSGPAGAEAEGLRRVIMEFNR